MACTKVSFLLVLDGYKVNGRRINVNVYTIADVNNMKNYPELNVFVSQEVFCRLEVATDRKKP